MVKVGKVLKRITYDELKNNFVQKLMYSYCSLIPVQEVRLIHEDTTGLRMTNLSMELLIAESVNLSKLKILELVKPREITVFFTK